MSTFVIFEKSTKHDLQRKMGYEEQRLTDKQMY